MTSALDRRHQPLDLVVPARASQVPRMRATVRGWLLAGDVRPRDVDALELAVCEAVTNAVRHAYADGTPGTVHLIADRTGDDVVIEVADRGRWRPARDDRQLGGLGLPLLERLVDDVRLTTGADGTRVRLVRHLGRRAGVRST